MKWGAPIRVAAGVALWVSALAAGAPSRAQPVPERAVEGEAAAGEPERVVESEAAADEPGAVYDPWVKMNRKIFAFNDALDRYLLEPIAIGWDTVVPHSAQLGIANVFENLATPRRVANDLLQGKPKKAGDDLGRFAINTTFGVLGIFDPATAQGIPAGDEDFGQTLGVWGVPAGPFLMLPFLGPSNPRDTAGLVVDGAVLSPEFYFAPWYVSYPASGTRMINARALVLETVRSERERAIDLYAAVRSAYVQYRTNQLHDRDEKPEDQDENEQLYQIEDEK
jgi:phospholipid-binding lipoprotein MlaA